MRKPWLRMTCESVSWILVSTELISVVLGQGFSFKTRPQIMWPAVFLPGFQPLSLGVFQILPYGGHVSKVHLRVGCTPWPAPD